MNIESDCIWAVVKLAEMKRKQARIRVFFGISFIYITNFILIIYCNNFISIVFFVFLKRA